MAVTKEKRLNVNYYRILPEGAPYQLIEGELIMTPAPSPEHQAISANLFRRLVDFVDQKAPGIVLYSPLDVYLDNENAFQPDIIFISKARLTIIKEDGIYGPPDLAIEVLSPSTAHYDLKEKFRVYERTGVREYWIVDPGTKSVEIYTNKDGRFSLVTKAEQGDMIESVLLEGFTIGLDVIFKGAIS